MVKIFVVLLIMSIVCVGKTAEYETKSLVCDGEISNRDPNSRFCVSKASIEKDTAQSKLIEAQQELIRLQIEEIRKKHKKP